MKTIKTLNESAEKLRRDYNFAGTNLEVFLSNVNREYAKFLEFCKSNPGEREVKFALGPVRDAIGLYNDQARNDRISQLQTMKYKDAFLDYMRTQCVAGLKIAINKESKQYELDNDPKVEIPAKDFYAIVCEKEYNALVDMCCIFSDNLTHFLRKNNAMHISGRSAHASYIAMRNQKGWNLDAEDLSKRKLCKQLNTIVKSMSFGVMGKVYNFNDEKDEEENEDKSILMIPCDLTFIDRGMCISASQADEAGAFVHRDESTIIKYIFRAMYTRYNGLAYDFQTKSRSDKAPLTYAANETAGENAKQAEFSPVVVAQAGGVTVTTVPEAKEADKAKKGTKKGAKSAK